MEKDVPGNVYVIFGFRGALHVFVFNRYLYIYMCVHTDIFIDIYIYVCVYTDISIDIYRCIYLYVYMYLLIYL